MKRSMLAVFFATALFGCGSGGEVQEDAQKLYVPEIIFLSEQWDGPNERMLKARLIEVFQSHDVQRAYLVRAKYRENDDEVVVLGIAGKKDLALVDAIRKVFFEMAGQDVFLDIAFLSPNREADVRAVAQPFFDLGP